MGNKLPYTVKSLDGTNQVSEGVVAALLEEYEDLFLTVPDTEEEDLYNGYKMQLIEQLLAEYGVKIEYSDPAIFFNEEDVEDGADINLPECTLSLDINLSELWPLK